MSLSKSVQNPVIGINKRQLLEVLWQKGCRPKDKDFELVARHQIYLLLGLREATCSTETNRDISSEAQKFRISVRNFWSPKKCGTNKDRLFAQPYFEGDIIVEVVPPSREDPDDDEGTPEVVPPSQDDSEWTPPQSTSGGRKPGPIKSFYDKGKSAKALDVAAVLANHEPGAIMAAAPRAASAVGFSETATAMRKMSKDPLTNPGLALDGMKNESKQCKVITLWYIFSIIHHHKL